jgi:hypothetical protein
MGHPDWKSETRNPFVRLLVQVSGTLALLAQPASQTASELVLVASARLRSHREHSRPPTSRP